MYFVGEIIISNWKPLAIEAICQDDRSKTVGDILLQVSTVPTLKLTLRYFKKALYDKYLCIFIMNYIFQTKTKSNISLECH